jgi:alpha-L-rhamnosidase
VDTGSAAVSFCRDLILTEMPVRAGLRVTAIGVYQVCLNGKKLGRQVLAPGWTSYDFRVQVQSLDLLPDLSKNNRLAITVAPGWAVGRLGYQGDRNLYSDHVLCAAELTLTYADGSEEKIYTDGNWSVWTNEVTFADLYDGETIDKTHEPQLLGQAQSDCFDTEPIDQVGEDICEQESLAPLALITTSKGERVLDFGQNMTGCVSLSIRAPKGSRVVLSCAEVLDSNGNFYNANYRTAKSVMTFICSGGEDLFKPAYSFYGFRYIRLDEFPDTELDPNAFRAVVIHSDMKRTGHFTCGDPLINQLYHNVIWGQKSNYLDIPTDCPQRDERLGWTGDAQVFCRTAAINYDVRKFFKKWLGELRLEQKENGAIAGVCPERFADYSTRISAGWGDCATIIPWTLYELYGDESFLSENFELMRRWVEYVRGVGPEEGLWLTGRHYGDWLAMDAGEDSYVGATSNDLIASAFFVHSIEILVRSCEILGRDVDEYRALFRRAREAFRSYFMENGMPKEEFPLTETVKVVGKPGDSVRKGVTQTALVLILHFNLCEPEERPALEEKLEELIHAWGNKMTTGFIGTPYILHVLTKSGRQSLAYELLFAEENPSWLYSVRHGATTMWEHWNGIKEDGSFWSTDMNSFNHYAYGAVADWLYGAVCGVEILPYGEGYKRVRIAPHPCRRLGFARCEIKTVKGLLISEWRYTEDGICYAFTVPQGTTAEISLPNGETQTVSGGEYRYTVAEEIDKA